MKNSNYYLNHIFGLEGKTVLVTGACGQLGKVLCKAFIETKAIVIGADSNIDQNNVYQDKSICYFSVDISNKQSVKDLFLSIYKKYDSIDILINNAGISTFEPFEERSEESFDFVSNVNLKGTFFCIQEYFKYQEKYKGGNVINIASIYGLISPDPRIYREGDRKNSEVYGATKAGIIQMTKYFAVHLSGNHIRVNAVSPGGIFNSENPQSEYFIAEYSKRNPMGRMAKVDEMVGAVLYLASDSSSYVTGHNLVVDGGMSCW